MNKSNVEIESRFIISKNVFKFFRDNYPMYEQNIVQCYAGNARYRSINYHGITHSTYFKTIKTAAKDNEIDDRSLVVRNEYEHVIQKDEFETVYKTSDNIIHKLRYGVRIDDNIFIEIDNFLNKYSGLYILEVEFNSIEDKNSFIIRDLIPTELCNEIFEIGTYLSNRKLAASETNTELIKLLNKINEERIQALIMK